MTAHEVIASFGAAVGVAGLVLSLAGYLLVVVYSARWLIAFLADPGTAQAKSAVFAVVYVGLTGGLLFLLRQRVRTLYGTLEVVSALAFAAHLAMKEAPGLTLIYLFQVMTTVYLVVRGLDNIAIGRDPDRVPDVFLRALRAIPRWVHG